MIVQDRVWLISGVSSGLGRAMAVAALDRGDRVAGLLRRESACRAFEALAPGRAMAIQADVSIEDKLVAAVGRCEHNLGPVDVLVNNAGQVLESTVEEAHRADVAALFDVNVLGPLALMQAVLPGMRARRTGRILNISSGGGIVGLPALGAYCASKFALEGLSEALAAEVRPLGIHVTIVEPGSFRTNLLSRNTRRTATAIPDYEDSCGRWRRQLAGMAGKEPNDPTLLAKAILALVDHPRPPLRLPLGDDAIGMVEGKLAAIAADVAPFRFLGQGLGYADQAALIPS